MPKRAFALHRLPITATAALAIVALIGSGAQAVDVGPTDADQIADVVANVAPNPDVEAPVQNSDGTLIVDTTGGDVDLPEAGDGAIKLDDLSISLPGDGAAQVAGDGTVVYADGDTS